MLATLFSPQSIAIVGASDTATKIGGIPLDYCGRFGYAGEVYAVNPRSSTVQGRLSYASLRAIGKPIDLAIFAIPQEAVDAAVDDAIAAGVRNIVLFSSGYAELGAAGAAAQQLLATKTRAAGIRVLGPNCLGMMNVANQIYATFTPAPNAGRVPLGRIGLVSQSGAFGAYAYSMARERGIGLSHWVTTGNEVDVQVADCIAWMATDPATEVIMAYMEGCQDGPRLCAALALAQSHRKPVVMVKVGTTAIGAAATASHTASLAGDDAVYNAIFARYGVLRAHTLTEFFDIAASVSIAGIPRDNSIGLYTVSGGVGALMADAASQHGMAVTELSASAQATLRGWVPFCAPRNPVDITGQVTNDFSLIERSACLMLEDQAYGSWLGFLAAAGTSPTFWPILTGLVTTLRQRFPNTVLAISTLLPPDKRAALEAMGCLVFADPSDGIRTLATLAKLRQSFETCPAAHAIAAPVAAPAESPIHLPAGNLSESQSLAKLKAAGVPVADHQLVQSADEAVQAWAALGSKIALKVDSADIPHKSDIGAVALNLQTEEEVRDAFTQIQANVKRARPDAHINGMLAARMVEGGVECIAGVRRDPVFGHVLVLGLGGVHAELLKDVSLRVLPIRRSDALAMVHALKGAFLLTGVRGKPAVDIEGLVDALMALAAFAIRAGDSLDSAEINPLICRPAAAGGCVAVDALVIPSTPDPKE